MSSFLNEPELFSRMLWGYRKCSILAMNLCVIKVFVFRQNKTVKQSKKRVKHEFSYYFFTTEHDKNDFLKTPFIFQIEKYSSIWKYKTMNKFSDLCESQSDMTTPERIHSGGLFFHSSCKTLHLNDCVPDVAYMILTEQN